VPVTRLFLQQIRSDTATVKWRGGGERACIAPGGEFRDWARCVDASIETAPNGSSHRMATFRDLQPDTTYLYAVDGRHDVGRRFRTAPATGAIPADGNTRIWILGDSGMSTFELPAEVVEQFGYTQEQINALMVEMKAGPRHVRDGSYRYFSATEEADLLLLLGDNAYLDGSDAQWQRAFFELYADALEKVAVWPTIGNHEMGVAASDLLGGALMGGVSTSSDPDSYADAEPDTLDRGLPYLDIFTLPTRGEAGGEASGTELYYSFDYANVHVVSLDSQLSIRDPELRELMKSWLVMDLSANQQDWTVVIFHHPPYSKSSHDSDEAAVAATLRGDQPMLSIRKELTPIFERYGVDLVYSGHSHAYERSWYLAGHRGDAASFDPSLHAELGPAGTPLSGQGSEAYEQVTRSGKDDHVVYIVAGASSHAHVENGTLDHPAHVPFPSGRHGLEVSGAVVLDAGRDTLTARYVDTNGQVVDHVVLRRSLGPARLEGRADSG
jgi:3',5'-cyclic AMP phosphodiesterase CpdA